MKSTLTQSAGKRRRCRDMVWLAVGLVACLTGCASAPHQLGGPDARASLPASGSASYYAPKYEGRRTASGEIYHQNAFTAAHRTLPFGTRVRVVALLDGRSAVVRINDRGPYVRGRLIDVSLAAARQLGIERRGLALVRLELVEPASSGAPAASRGSGQSASATAWAPQPGDDRVDRSVDFRMNASLDHPALR